MTHGDPFAGLDGLDDELKAAGVPALSAAAMVDGEIVARTWGERAAGQGAVEADTRFQAASVSKPVTAIAVLRLVEQGRLDLDADVNETLSSWKVPAVEGWQPRVTLRHLLTHTAGTTVHGFGGYKRDAEIPTVPQILDGAPPANSAAVVVDQLPGYTWRYSGGGTTIAQQLMVDVTGQSFPELLAELVLGPCATTRSTFAQPLPGEFHGTEAIAHAGTEPIAGGWHVYPEMAAAGLWTTPSDLLRIARAVSASVAGAAHAILPVELAQLLVTPQFPEITEPPMGVGFFLEAVGGPDARFGHTGGNAGFISILSARVDGRAAFAAMANAGAAGPSFNTVFDAVAEAVDWGGYTPRRDRPPPGPDLMAALASTFKTDAGREFTFDTGSAGVALLSPGQPPLPLRFGSSTHFASALRTEINFDVEAEKIVAVRIRQNGVDTRAARVTD